MTDLVPEISAAIRVRFRTSPIGVANQNLSLLSSELISEHLAKKTNFKKNKKTAKTL